jgi:hypothetical protein
MNFKKLSVLFAAGAMILSMLACNLGKSPADTSAPGSPAAETSGNNSSGACANPYFPIIVGASWDYKITGPFPETYTESILSVDEKGFSEQSVFGKGAKREGKWSCANGDLTALDPTSGGSASVDVKSVSAEFQTQDVSGVTIPGKINPGDTWNQSVTLTGTETIGGQQIPATNKFTNACKAAALESVTVQAGTFDAVRVECQTDMEITFTLAGNPTTTPVKIISTIWYAKNIGMVKTTATGFGADTVTELTSYKIP